MWHLSGKGGEQTKDVLLLDVAPLSIGTEVEGGLFVKVIERNTVIPTKKPDEFTTVEDNQVMVKVIALDGNRIKLSRKAVLREQQGETGGENSTGGNDRNGQKERSQEGARKRDGDQGGRGRPRRRRPPDNRG